MTSVPPTPAPAYVSASISAPMPAPTFPPEAFPLDSQYRYSTLPPLETDTVGVDSISKESQNRAGLTTQPRLVLLSSVGGFWGFAMGSFLGGRQAGLQYLAENAHRLPTTVQGWYFYHKTKNYRVALGGVKRGLRFAARTGGLCLMYGAIEAGLDDIRGEADVANSVVAGVTTGTLFSTLTKLTRGSFRYSLFFGAAFGLAAGGLSDLHRYASGHSPLYVQWISQKVSKESSDYS